MVKIPTPTFLDHISEKKIYYFSSNKINSKEPHFFICLKRDDNLLLMSCCTSQEEKLKKHIEKRGLPFETLVYVAHSTSNVFIKDTFINCNTCFEYTIDSFRDMYESNSIEYKGEINDNHYFQILNGIKKSPVVENDIKNKIPNPESII